MSILPFNIFGRNKNEMKRSLFMETKNNLLPQNALYYVLRGEASEIKLRPDLFPTVTVEPNTIVMKSSMSVATPYGRIWRYFIPFTSSDKIITDYNTGIIEIYPTYRLLAIDCRTPSEFVSATINGVYDMASGVFEDILLTENWEVVSPAEAAMRKDTTFITRQAPVSINPTPAMSIFYNQLKDINDPLTINL